MVGLLRILRTSRYQTIDKRCFALKQVLVENFLQVIAIEDKLIFKEINVGSLIPISFLAKVSARSPRRLVVYRRSPR